MKRTLVIAGSFGLLAGAVVLVTAQATRPAFTVSKETTLIEGPRLADGTIDYITAINDSLGPVPPPEQNAAVELLRLRLGPKTDPQALKLRDMLGGGALTEVPADPYGSEANEVRSQRPWTPANDAEGRAWLRINEQAYQVIERAVACKSCYTPFLDDGSHSAIKALPTVSIYFSARQMLSVRAMARAGAAEWDGALADLRRIRTLARLADQIPTGIHHIVALAADLAAIQGYAALANMPGITEVKLRQLREELGAFELIPEHDPRRERVEQFIGLDFIMMCIRGRSAELMLTMAMEFDQTKQIDLGDWANADWDASLREVVRLYERFAEARRGSFEERDEALRKRAAEPAARAIPAGIFSEDGKVGNTAGVEAFLKRQPGETREAFSQRVARWLAGDVPDVQRRMLALEERVRLHRDMAMVVIRLAEHRLQHGAFPANLETLGTPVLRDTFARGPIQYRREPSDQAGYTLWSVGMNGRDESGKEDDFVYTSGQNKSQ